MRDEGWRRESEVKLVIAIAPLAVSGNANRCVTHNRCILSSLLKLNALNRSDWWGCSLMQG